MTIADWITRPLFGKSETGIVFYRFGNKGWRHQVNHTQIERLRSATLVTAIIAGLMAFSGIGYFAALTFIISFSQALPQDDVGFDLRWLYLGDAAQICLIGIVVLIYNGVVSKILRNA